MASIRVLIVDDSVVIRRLLAESLARDPEIEVVGKAPSGRIAIAKATQLSPDVVALDVEMPEMDGLETLAGIRRVRPTLPVIMLCKNTEQGTTRALAAVAAGANDHVCKPDSALSTAVAIQRLHDDILPRIKTLGAAALTRVAPEPVPIAGTPVPPAPPAERAAPAVLQLARPAGAAAAPPRAGLPAVSGISGPTDALRALSAKLAASETRAAALSVQVVGAVAPVPPAPDIPPPVRLPSGADGAPLGVLAIGVSTGGPNALASVLTDLPANFPLPVLIVQHMPPTFTRLLAERLSRRTPMPVREAQGGEVVRPGEVWIAPGDHHMVVERTGAGLQLSLHQAPHENSCRPSVDVLFRTVADACRDRAIAVVLTGMGQDGLNGCRWIKDRHGRIIAQDQESSVVWGMPGFVARAGLADHVLPLGHIASQLLKMTDPGVGPRIARAVGDEP